MCTDNLSVGLRHLNYFISVAENKSFVETSKESFVTQPTVSYYINKLENDFGVKLFYRDYKKNSMELTFEGQILYNLVRPFVIEIKNLYNYWQNESYNRQNNTKDKITTGTTYTPATYILPRLIPALVKENRDIQIDFYTDISENIYYDIAQLKTDIGLVTLRYGKQIPYKELMVMSTRRERVRIIVRPDHPCANKTLPCEELKGFTLIAPQSNTAPGYSIRIQLIEQKVAVTDFFEMDSVELAKKSILEGFNGGALVPEVAVNREIKMKDLAYLYFPDINLFIDYAIIIHNDNAKLADKKNILDAFALNFL